MSIDSKLLRKQSQNLSRKKNAELFLLLVECSDILKKISPNKRKPWLSRVIEDLYDEQGGRCALCDEPLEFGKHHVDHKIPFCYGGGNERNNIQLAHPSCNRNKRAEVDPHDLLLYLEDRYMNI